jgi:hypothetical protein
MALPEVYKNIKIYAGTPTAMDLTRPPKERVLFAGVYELPAKWKGRGSQ